MEKSLSELIAKLIVNYIVSIAYIILSNNIAEIGQQLGRGDQEWVIQMIECMLRCERDRILTRSVLDSWIGDSEQKKKPGKYLSTLTITFTNEKDKEEALVQAKLVKKGMSHRWYTLPYENSLVPAQGNVHDGNESKILCGKQSNSNR